LTLAELAQLLSASIPVDRLQFLLAVVVAALTAIWALRKWFAERAERDLEEKKRIRALYVNPFLLACEDLQSRLYNILELQGLEPLKKHYPDGSYAEEILYMIAQYFGWQQCMYRYSPYANDQLFLRLTAAIEHDFATDKKERGGLGPLCFFRPEQRSLGQLAIDRTSGEFGSELVTVSFPEFCSRLKEHGYSESKAVGESLEALREAKYQKLQKTQSVRRRRKDSEQAEDALWPDCVRQRLEFVQTHLVELLEYLEKQGNVTFFVSPGKEKKRKTAIPHATKKWWRVTGVRMPT